MQKLRSHIAKSYLISLICAGLCLFMARPVNAQQSSTVFSSWLSTIVDHTDSSDLKQELETLSESGANVYKLMEHASIVMSNTGQKADLPLATSEASNHIYQVLLQQWNHFSTGKGMANIPPPEIIKSLITVSVEKCGKAFFDITPSDRLGNTFSLYADMQNDLVHFYNSFEPMITGIAINAP